MAISRLWTVWARIKLASPFPDLFLKSTFPWVYFKFELLNARKLTSNQLFVHHWYWTSKGRGKIETPIRNPNTPMLGYLELVVPFPDIVR